MLQGGRLKRLLHTTTPLCRITAAERTAERIENWLPIYRGLVHVSLPAKVK